MRIAVSGTHCSGKSTLIDEFLRVRPEFLHEPEPYEVMVEELGGEFSAEPCVEDFYRQLEFSIERLQQHATGESVIYERCPVDFLAYIVALDSRVDEATVRTAAEAIQNLDLIVYLPLDGAIEAFDAEFPKLRKAVDRELSAIFREDRFEITSSSDVVIVETRGTLAQRLSTLVHQTRSLAKSRIV